MAYEKEIEELKRKIRRPRGEDVSKLTQALERLEKLRGTDDDIRKRVETLEKQVDGLTQRLDLLSEQVDLLLRRPGKGPLGFGKSE